ncbi:dTDP-4-dehydrorhamnose reductase [Dongia mobilis]|uniref:dTDP-4-dehydrorhamnose reductase n=1 Tax=Dongia sp. TaxID=1977262 RepID=UPI0026E991E7
MTRPSRCIAVIGRQGQLARELADLAWPADLRPHFLGRAEFDLADAGTLQSRLATLRPIAIINTAAHTAVDLCESEPALAHHLNADLPAMLAQLAFAAGIPLVHVSTDYVFAGDQPRARCEEDLAAPQSVYARTKLAGEAAIRASGASSIIVRSAGLFGSHGQNFLKTILAKAAAGGAQPIRMVADQISTPTPAAALAAALQRMAIDLAEGRSLPPLLHFAGQPPVSWFDFTAAILAALSRTGTAPLPDLIPVRLGDIPRAAARPLFSALDCNLARQIGYPPPDWCAALDPLVARLSKERIAA